MTIRYQKASAYLNQSEMLFRFHNSIDSTLYPHAHDYYELTFVQSGNMIMTINGQTSQVHDGYFLLVRPNDVHSKFDVPGGHCKHTNIAFLADTFNDIFDFLRCSSQKDLLLNQAYLAPIRIASSDLKSIALDMARLSMVSPDDPTRASFLLRSFILRILSTYFIEPHFASNPFHNSLPPWLHAYLGKLTEPEILRLGTDYLYSSVKFTKSHICREFSKHLNMTPTDFINDQRLIYAANLLIQSDLDILTISEEAGFSSLSHFYHLFKKKYHVTPKKYRDSTVNL